MKKKTKSRKILNLVSLVILVLIVGFFAVRAIGQAIYNQTPKGGINESMYVDINGTEQWISIYGKNIDNPVLLYLHGGPGSATSDIDYAFTRKWADVYTVVTWDQRNCGKSYDAEQNDIILTRELFMSDGKEVTEFILDYLSKDKITILGHSWGSIYGANLVLEYPEYYECFIGTGQLVDYLENEEAFRQEALIWADGDEETLDLVNQLTPNNVTMEHIITRNTIMQKYGYDMMVNGSDYNLVTTIIFNPYYSIIDWINYFKRDMSVYLDFFASEEFASFSLKDRVDYQVPFYNINGEKDYQTNYKLAAEYFEQVNAPYKQIYMMKNMTHGLLESDSEGFSEIVHQIAEREVESGYDIGKTSVEKEIDSHESVDFYGVWKIDKAVLKSKMYTGTVMDGDFEENIYDPEDYIGMEIEYNPDYFRLGSEKYTNPQYVITKKTVKEINGGGDFYDPDLYELILKEKIQIVNENNYSYLSEVPLYQVEVNFSQEVSYGDFGFLPVGGQIIVLNENTVLIGIWGKILLAYKA